jgi:hypothetical protein
MALNLVRLGRYATAAEADYGEIAAGQMRASVTDAATVNFWAVKVGAWMGKSGGTNATARLGVYETDASKNPDDRYGYTDAVTVSTSQPGASGGAAYTPDVDGDPLMIRSGQRYGIAILGAVAGIRHSMRQASAITADNELFYDRSGLSQPPPDPFGSYSAATEGHLTAWIEGWENEAPEAPDNLSPSGTINDTAPAFEADFRDLNGGYGDSSGNGVDTLDHCTQYTIQVRRVSDGVSFWNATYDAASAEQGSDSLSRAYGGTTLVRGTAYEWRMRTKDRFGAWGDWTAWTSFTPANLGYVTLDSDPTGKIEDNTPDFKGRWTHQSATTMKTVQVRLLSPSGTVLQAGANYNIADVASSASPGTLFTVPWADTGFTTLAWGTNYRYQIRGNDGSQWSDWSASRSFKTNAAPSIPSNLSPANGSIFTSFPLLSFSMTDADDTTASGLTATIRVTRPNATTVDVTPTYNATTGKWEFQTTATELSAFGTYSWYAYGYDGTLYSGEATSSGAASTSATNTFTYAQGPTVTIDEPDSSDTIATAGFTVDWTVTGQVKYKVAIYEAGTTTLVYQSNGGAWTVSATGSHTVPSGYVRNGETYDVVVTVEDSTPLSGSDTNTDVLIDYTAPDPVANFEATPVEIGTDPVPTAVRLSWDQTAYAAPEFVETTITRTADGGPDDGTVILARITDPSVVALYDYTPASGYEYTYGASVTILTGLDEVSSDPVTATAQVDLTTTVLTLIGNGGTYRANLTNVRERPDRRTIDEAVYVPPNQTRPTTVRSRTRYYTTQITALLIDTDEATALQHRADLEALDAQGGTVCLRYANGTKRFGKIADLTITPELGGYISVAFTFREERYAEGVD